MLHANCATSSAAAVAAAAAAAGVQKQKRVSGSVDATSRLVPFARRQRIVVHDAQLFIKLFTPNCKRSATYVRTGKYWQLIGQDL